MESRFGPPVDQSMVRQGAGPTEMPYEFEQPLTEPAQYESAVDPIAAQAADEHEFTLRTALQGVEEKYAEQAPEMLQGMDFGGPKDEETSFTDYEEEPQEAEMQPPDSPVKQTTSELVDAAQEAEEMGQKRADEEVFELPEDPAKT